MSAIWKVPVEGDDEWFATRKEAHAFCDGAKLYRDVTERVEIACYLNPNQLVAFIKKHFSKRTN
jgi:hypothetical protein